jgi:hypothetical protein
MQPLDKTEEAQLKAEWAKMQGFGAGLQRQRLVATLASTAIAGAGFAASVVLYFLWPLTKIPVMLLVAPIALSLGPAWAVRNKLWPKGQFR